MGKKKRMIAYPQKFGRKFASHPRVIAAQSNQEKIEELPSVSEEVPTPILEEVAAELQPAPEPETKEVEPAPEVEKSEPKKPAPKAATTRKKKAVTKRKAATTRAKKTTSKK